MNELPVERLQELLNNNTPFQDAVTKLEQEGFTQLQVTDAKIQLDAQNQAVQNDSDTPDISQHPELAGDLLKATSDMNQNTAKTSSSDDEHIALLPGGLRSPASGGFRVGYVRGNLYVMIVGMFVILLAIFAALKYVLKV